MSYDIYYIKKPDLNNENVYDILETEAVDVNDETFISKDAMDFLVKELESIGLIFKVNKSRDYYELSFPSYQLSLYENQIAISLPYWGKNSDSSINGEMKQISNVLIQNNFIGFDPQTEAIIREPYDFKSSFDLSNASVQKHISSEIKDNRHELGKEGNSSGLKNVGLVLGGLLLAFLIWKFINK